jgi:hypothetical protein
MSEKRKADVVTDKMRQRLLTNRNGKIATDQWLDLVTEPLVVLLLLAVPAAIILGPGFTAFFISLRLPFILLIVLLVLGFPLVSRARRYARAPIHFEILYAESDPRAPLKFWKPQRFERQDGQIVSFHKRLAPFMFFRPGAPYLIYFLEDPRGYVLLSVAPVDHPDAQSWYPTKFFERRHSYRAAPDSTPQPPNEQPAGESAQDAPPAASQRSSAPRKH